MIEAQERQFRWVEDRPLVKEQETVPNLMAKIHSEHMELYVETVRTPPSREAIGQECADIVLYVMSLCNLYGIDLGEAIFKKQNLNDRRFPVHMFDGSTFPTFSEAYEEAKRLEKEGLIADFSRPKPTPSLESAFEKDNGYPNL